MFLWFSDWTLVWHTGRKWLNSEIEIRVKWPLKIRTLANKSAKDISNFLHQVSPSCAPSYSTITRWASRFREGRDSQRWPSKWQACWGVKGPGTRWCTPISSTRKVRLSKFLHHLQGPLLVFVTVIQFFPTCRGSFATSIQTKSSASTMTTLRPTGLALSWSSWRNTASSWSRTHPIIQTWPHVIFGCLVGWRITSVELDMRAGVSSGQWFTSISNMYLFRTMLNVMISGDNVFESV